MKVTCACLFMSHVFCLIYGSPMCVASGQDIEDTSVAPRGALAPPGHWQAVT